MSTNYPRTAQQIITRALRIIGGISQGETPATQAVTDALEALNLILKDLSMKGVILQKSTTVQINYSLTLSEVLGPYDGLNYQCIRGHTSTADNKPGSTTAGSNWSLYWKRGGVNGVAWVLSTPYVTPCMTTLDTSWDGVFQATWRKDQFDYPLDIITYSEYQGIGEKMVMANVPSKLGIEYMATGMNAYIYPIPQNPSSCALMLQVSQLFTDLPDGTVTPELAARWTDYLTYQLASHLADEYTLPLPERAYITSKAEKMLTQCLSFNDMKANPRIASGAFSFNNY